MGNADRSKRGVRVEACSRGLDAFEAHVDSVGSIETGRRGGGERIMGVGGQREGGREAERADRRERGRGASGAQAGRQGGREAGKDVILCFSRSGGRRPVVRRLGPGAPRSLAHTHTPATHAFAAHWPHTCRLGPGPSS